mmetsp:Transcript_64812/g.187882  ORF Transcript_64812/g.187882 Transcript_64812/m.187882 type:complete len:239 (+) Transcript_64812:210-926(+)
MASAAANSCKNAGRQGRLRQKSHKPLLGHYYIRTALLPPVGGLWRRSSSSAGTAIGNFCLRHVTQCWMCWFCPAMSQRPCPWPKKNAMLARKPMTCNAKPWRYGPWPESSCASNCWNRRSASPKFRARWGSSWATSRCRATPCGRKSTFISCATCPMRLTRLLRNASGSSSRQALSRAQSMRAMTSPTLVSNATMTTRHWMLTFARSNWARISRRRLETRTRSPVMRARRCEGSANCI